jgi:hypothetical protein
VLEDWSVSLESWKSFFEIGGVALLALTFVFGAGALIVNNRLNLKQAKELDEFKIKFEDEQQKTALAQKEAAEAKQLAGSFERDIAAANQRAAEANEIAEGEKLARIKLEAQIAPRRLTPEQQVKIAENCSRFKTLFKGKYIKVVSYILDTEAFVLAEQVVGALRASGMVVDDDTMLITPTETLIFGISVFGSDSELAKEIAVAIGSSGKPVAVSFVKSDPTAGTMHFGSQNARTHEVTILVGLKPPDHDTVNELNRITRPTVKPASP